MIEDSKLQGYEIDTDQDIKNLIGDFHSSTKKNISTIPQNEEELEILASIQHVTNLARKFTQEQLTSVKIAL